jgi:hypothetical protein
LPPALAGRGVVAGAGLAEHSALLAGGDVAVSDPPDHRVHTAAGLWTYRGALHGKVALEHPFDLTDGDGAELLDGESFWAALTLGPGSVTLSKGAKSITPQRPILPLWEPFLGWVRVDHDPSGIPQIDLADLDGERLYDRFHLEPGDGLDATLHAGQAIGPATWCYRAHSTPLVFAPGAESFVWLLATGKPLVTTSPEPPEPAALLLWEAETDATSIVSVVDRRVFITPSHVVTLAGELPAVPGVIDRLTLTGDRLYVERVVVDVPELGGGTAGETVFEVLRNGATIYPSSAEDDRDPASLSTPPSSYTPTASPKSGSYAAATSLP